LVDLYDYVIDKIKDVESKPYTDYIPSDAPYPRIQIKFPNTLPNGWGELNLLEIDIWDKNHSKAQVESIADNIDKIFKRLNETTNDYCIQVYRNTPYKLNIPDPDVEIRRRQLRYIIKIYRKE
jgi:hypothetical protein